MTVREFKARLDTIGDDELCCGTFWLDDDFLSIDPALTRAEIASAMEIAEDNHDAWEGGNWWHLEWAISEMKQGGDLALYLWQSAKNELRTLLSESYA